MPPFECKKFQETIVIKLSFKKLHRSADNTKNPNWNKFLKSTKTFIKEDIFVNKIKQWPTIKTTKGKKMCSMIKRGNSQWKQTRRWPRWTLY